MEKKICCYFSIPSLEQWLIKLQGNLINTPAFLELPCDKMRHNFLAFQGVKKKKKPFRTDGTEWKGHNWIIIRECQIMFQTRLAGSLIPGVSGLSPRCGAEAAEPLAVPVLTGILPPQWVICWSNLLPEPMVLSTLFQWQPDVIAYAGIREFEDSNLFTHKFS